MRAGLGARLGLTVGSGGRGLGWAPRPSFLPFYFLLSSNFSNYKARFSMPGNTEGLWYR